MRIANVFVLTVLLVLTACDNKKAAADEPAGDTTTATTATAPADPPSQKAETAGTKHDPPIELEKVPDGHWYCDMGTAHYSSAEKGDGNCPLCGMKLKQMDHAAMGHPEGGHHADDDHHHGTNGHHEDDGHHGGDDHHHE